LKPANKVRVILVVFVYFWSSLSLNLQRSLPAGYNTNS